MKIQIIDDSLFVRKTISKFLKENAPDAQIIESKSGTEGMDHFIKESPDLVTLDLLMDDVHGTDVLKFIREHSSSCFVTVVSSDIQKTMQERISSLGASLFLGKPFTQESAKTILESYRDSLAAG